jgi:hypothetical protein
MKTLLISLIFVFVNALAAAQYGEFKMHENGLVYPEKTIRQLRVLVDSLAISFQSCGLLPQYYSVPQASVVRVSASGADARQLRKQLKKQPTLDELKKGFPELEWEHGLRLLLFRNQNDSNYSYLEMPLPGRYGREMEEVNYSRITHKNRADNWIYKFYPSDKYQSAELIAYYLQSDFESVLLPDSLARLIAYVDCMVDTTTPLYLVDQPNYYRQEMEATPAIDTFMSWANYLTRRPVYAEGDTSYWARYQLWEAEQLANMGVALENYPWLNDYFQLAIAEAIRLHASNEQLEAYVAAYHSPAVALNMKRNRIVYGMCSMDDSPRRHAIGIAMLAAEAVEWPVFLRAHLNVLNDNFPRLSDGSYAWGRRGTYLKELEAIGLDAVPLLLGTALRYDQATEKHYFSQVGRLGRALAESAQSAYVGHFLVAQVANTQLDEFNRLLFYYLFTHFHHYLEDKEAAADYQSAMDEAIKTLPVDIYTALVEKKP